MIRVALVTMALASPAWACPTAEDMARGVLVTLSDGETEQHQRLPDGRTRLVWTSEGDTWSDLLQHGHYGVAYWSGDGLFPLSDASVITYSVPLSELPKPAPGLTFETSGAEAEQGRETLRFTQVDNWGQATTTDIDECQFDVLEGERIRADEGMEPLRSVFLHIPALGISILTEYQGDDGPVTLDIVSIEAVQ